MNRADPRLTDGLIVDLFAGGGGASQGIEAALGRPVDIGINHDPVALAVHKANHPETRHLEADIWEVRPEEATEGRPVAVLWASPDCTHFSVAKGGKPRQKRIRSLAWAVVRWARAVHPAVIFLENVTEFKTWGPLTIDGRPDKRFLGRTFRRWKRELERLGYQVDFRTLDASLYGAPTRRRRLFMIARCDGKPIVWPRVTHGKGKLPLHTAAECIDWSIPCPSIFDRKRPLAEKTMWRIAQGLKRFVFETPKPFVVKVNHGGREARVEDIDQPLTTVTAQRRGHALVTPYVAGVGGRASQTPPTGADEPVGTITAKNDRAVVVPSLQRHFGESVGQGVDQPMPTVMPAGLGKTQLLAPTLVQTGYGERAERWKCPDCGHAFDRSDLPTCGCTKCGSEADPVHVKAQDPRAPGLLKPLGTVVAGGSKHALVAAFLARQFGYTPSHERKPGSNWGGVVGQGMDEPTSTVTAKDHHALTAAHLLKLRGQCHSTGMEDPIPTISAQGTHLAEVRAFLTAYYSTDGNPGNGQDLREPMRTVTSKDRLGLVTIEGTEYVIADIGLRMLEPHELLRAQFGKYAASYDLSAAKTKTARVRLIGNSVCPEVAEAIVRENLITESAAIEAA